MDYLPVSRLVKIGRGSMDYVPVYRLVKKHCATILLRGTERYHTPEDVTLLCHLN